jgi:uncharacterized membrane protein YidH (DUF202 family)
VKLQPYQFALWALSFLSYALLAAIMLKSGAVRRFRGLFALSVFEVALAASLFHLSDRAHYRQYFYLYWGASIVRSVIGFAVLQDIVRNIPGTKYIPKQIWNTFIAVALCVTIACVWISTGMHPHTFKVTSVALAMARGMYMAWGTFAVCLFSQMGMIGLGWTTVPLRVAIGFIISTLISLTASYGMSQWPQAGFKIDQTANSLLLGVWIYWAFAMGKPHIDPDRSLLPELIDAARAVSVNISTI